MTNQITTIQPDNICKRFGVFNITYPKMHQLQFVGMTESLFNLMEEFDVSLLSWKHYLRTVCSHCERSGLLNVLYAIQLRTHDHVRAAITCVRFYLKGAGSYAALKEREYQLTRARGHLNDRRKSSE